MYYTVCDVAKKVLCKKYTRTWVKQEYTQFASYKRLFSFAFNPKRLDVKTR